MNQLTLSELKDVFKSGVSSSSGSADKIEENLPIALLVALFVVCWAFEIFVTKLAFNAGASVVPFTIHGSSFALLVLCILVLPRRCSELAELFFKHRNVFAMVMFANVIHYGLGASLYLFGLSFTKAVNVAFLVTLSSLTTTFFARLFIDEPIPMQKVLALVAMLIGAYLLTTNLQEVIPQLGDLLILGAVVFWSLGNVLMRKTLRDTPVSGEVVSLLKPVAGLPLFFVAIALADFYPESLRAMFKESLLQFEYFPYSMLGGTLAALLWIFLYRALKIAEASYVAMLGLFTPVLVTILAVVFLGETMSLIQVLGAVIILGAGFYTHRMVVAN